MVSLLIVAEIMEHLTTMVTGASAHSRTPRVPTINACSMLVFDLRVMSPTSYQTAPPRAAVERSIGVSQKVKAGGLQYERIKGPIILACERC